MQAVILAAGKSTRTQPLTINTPKPLLRILDTTIIEHNLDQLVETGQFNEVLIVVGFKKELIMEHLGLEYKGLKITYIIQKNINGTGGALLECKEFLKEKFLVLNGDDLFSAKDISKVLKHKYCILVKKVENPSIWGIISPKSESLVKSLEEKPKEPKSDLGNVGIYLFDNQIFSHELKLTSRNEYEITDYIKHLIDVAEVNYEIIEDYWVPIGYPWNYLEANVFMLKKKIDTEIILGKIEENVTINGSVYVGEGTVIKSGTCIEGPAYIGKNCIIGPQAYIRKDSILMDNVNIRAEIIDSVIMSGSVAKHVSYLGHSVIGEKCNIAAGTITADYRHDAKNHLTLVKETKIDTLRRKLGAFIGDNVNTGIGTLIYPGRKIWPNETTLPGEIVKRDIITED